MKSSLFTHNGLVTLCIYNNLFDTALVHLTESNYFILLPGYKRLNFSNYLADLMAISFPHVAVIGAGISGLSTANLLVQSSYKSQVTLIAENFSPHTTSDLAGASLWIATQGTLASAGSRYKLWARTTYKYFYNLAASPLAGKLCISLVPYYEMLDDEKREEPWWKNEVLGFRHVGEEEMKLLQYPVEKKCWSYSMLMMPCGPFLTWQMEQFKTNGGVVVQRRLESLEEIDGTYDIIVNCTGLGSRQLVNDPEVYPVRGQLIVVKAPWVKHAFDYETKDSVLTYVLPRANDVVLGGTADVGNWSTQVDPLVSKAIMERCCMYVPGLSTAEVVKEVVGLRPGRSSVRLEVDEVTLKKSTIVHNYGHGGQGVVFSRGCALETVSLVEECLYKSGFLIKP